MNWELINAVGVAALWLRALQSFKELDGTSILRANLPTYSTAKPKIYDRYN